MKKLLLLLSVSVFVFSACATRSTQVRFADGIKAEEKQADKLAFLYLDDDEKITSLTYSASEYAAARDKLRRGNTNFMEFGRYLFDGPEWVALKPGIAYLGIFKAGYTTGTMQMLLKGGSFYRIEEANKTLRIVYDADPNLNAETLKTNGIR